MTKTVYQKIGIASLILMASIGLSRIIGLFREMAIAYIGGARGNVDAYQIAFVIPEILNHIVASGFLSVTFIPIFSGYLAKEREEEGWKVFSIILNSFGILLILLIGIAFVLTPLLITWIAPGIKDPIVMEKAIQMTRIILPAQFFFFTGAMFAAVQFAKENFIFPAFAPLIYNIGIISGGMILGPFINMEGFSWGVLAGAFTGNFAIQYWGAKRIGMKYTMTIDFKHPDFLSYLKLTLPLMLGLTMMFSTEFFFKFFGSYLPEGSIACLNYGLRTMFIIVAILGQAAGTASFPYLARLAAEKNIAGMNMLINSTLKYLSVIIPFSTLLIVLRHEVVQILFERGKFDAAASAQTSTILVYLMLGAFAFSAQSVVSRGYYALQNTFFPAVYSTAGVALSIPFYILGIKLMGADGVAFAVSASAILQVIILYGIWNHRTQNLEGNAVFLGYFKIILFSIPLGFFLERVRLSLSTLVTTLKQLEANITICITISLIFLIILVCAGYIFKIREFTDIFKQILKKRT